eukprot:69323_1
MVYQNCGGFTTGCNYLAKIANASENMMVERAKTSDASNILIMQHYPGEYKRLSSLFKDNRVNTSNDDIVWSIFGHAHVQKCDHTDERSGECDAILSGGGGGCCMEKSLRGFYVIGFNENGEMIQPLKFNDPSISCEYPCDESIELTPEYMIKQ